MHKVLITDEQIALYHEIATKTNAATIRMFNQKILTAHITGGIGLVATLLFMLLLKGVLGSAVFFIPMFSIPILAVYYFTTLMINRNARREAVDRISHGKLTYAQYAAIEKTEKGNASEQPISSTGKDENRLYEIKRVAHIHATLGICKWVPILLIIVLFAMPLITIQFALGEIVLEEYEVSAFDFVCSHSNNETLKEELLADMTAEFIGIEPENYKNFFSIFYAFGNHIKGSVNGFGDVLNIFKVMLLEGWLPIGSIFAILIYVVAALISIVKYAKNGMVETALRRSDASVFTHAFGTGRESFASRPAGYFRKTIGYWVKFLIGYSIAIFFVSYLPMRLVSFLDQYDFVSVHPLWYIWFWGALAIHLVFTVMEYVYSTKNAYLLQGCAFMKSAK